MGKVCHCPKNKPKKISRKIWNSTVSTNMLAMWLVWKESYQIPDIIHVVKLIMITPRAYPQPVWFWFLVMKLCLQSCAQFGAWFWELPRRCSMKLFWSTMVPHMRVSLILCFISRLLWWFLNSFYLARSKYKLGRFSSKSVEVKRKLWCFLKSRNEEQTKICLIFKKTKCF